MGFSGSPQHGQVRYPVCVFSSLPSPPRSPPSAQLPQVPADPTAQPGDHQPGVGSPRASQRDHHGLHPPIPALYVPCLLPGDKSGNPFLPAVCQGRDIHEELENSMVGQTGVGKVPEGRWWVLSSSPRTQFLEVNWFYLRFRKILGSAWGVFGVF